MIADGYVKSVAPGSEVESEMSKFGVELLYINAGLVEKCHASNEFDLLERSIALLERDTSMMQRMTVFNCMLMFQAALGESGSIRYPRSFRRSDHADSGRISDGDY